MGYLGSNLGDYWPFQLIDEAYRQIQNDGIGPMSEQFNELVKSLARLNAEVYKNMAKLNKKESKNVRV